MLLAAEVSQTTLIKFLENFTGEVSTVMYTYLLVFMLVAAGLYFTIRTKAVQIVDVKEMFTVLTEQKHVEGDKAVSSFQALMISTASRVGTGNIAGIAAAIALGGPGAIFWMWLMAIVGSASAFVESTLAQIFKIRADNGEFRGGPAYYIEQALNKRWLGVVFAIALIICFAYGFNALQAYNISSSLEYYIPNYTQTGAPIALGLLLSVTTAFIIFGGTKRIGIVTSLIVPVMAIVYILIGIYITVTHLGDLPRVFSFIFSKAFDFQSIFGGFAGSAIVIGIKRGLFSNEAGMGSAPNAAASASVSHPVKQGFVQALSVYIDTLVICTCSAMIVMFFYVNTDIGDLKGIPLVQQAVNWGIGNIGIHFMTFAIFAFAFSSIVGNYFYAESNIKFIKDNPVVLFVFRITCVVAVFIGCQASFDLAWNVADIVMGVMAFINIIAIFLLGKWAFKALDDYRAQRKSGLDPVFVAEAIDGLPATECWHLKHVEKFGGKPIEEYIQDMFGIGHLDPQDASSIKKAKHKIENEK